MQDDWLQQFFDSKTSRAEGTFGRLVDVKDWVRYRGVFTDDCQFDLAAAA